MPSYKKPNMARFNSQVSKLRSASNQFERKANQAVRELKSIERKAKSYQNKLRSMSAQSLSTMPSLYLGSEYDEVSSFLYDDYDKEYDVFISHASEDKEEVARPLAEALRKNGLSVWYDEFELKIGDSLRRKIDKGIANSNFGIIVISRDFISKGWTNYELDGLITKAVNGEQTMLPIWHNVTKREVINYSPSLADKLARSTTDFTVEEIADEIADLINERKGA
ncbi:MAG: toll/interleukin-1 receptor domain-containing protein [Ruminococcaceae bacterium]|nr:toll/interleukin-1 receptor domain-containing protein [Oscillospiraceae bacterium]